MDEILEPGLQRRARDKWKALAENIIRGHDRVSVLGARHLGLYGPKEGLHSFGCHPGLSMEHLEAVMEALAKDTWKAAFLSGVATRFYRDTGAIDGGWDWIDRWEKSGILIADVVRYDMLWAWVRGGTKITDKFALRHLTLYECFFLDKSLGEHVLALIGNDGTLCAADLAPWLASNQEKVRAAAFGALGRVVGKVNRAGGTVASLTCGRVGR